MTPSECSREKDSGSCSVVRDSWSIPSGDKDKCARGLKNPEVPDEVELHDSRIGFGFDLCVTADGETNEHSARFDEYDFVLPALQKC